MGRLGVWVAALLLAAQGCGDSEASMRQFNVEVPPGYSQQPQPGGTTTGGTAGQPTTTGTGGTATNTGTDTTGTPTTGDPMMTDPGLGGGAGDGAIDDPTMMGGGAVPAVTGREPSIPAVSGDCPSFTSSSATVGGLGGITIDAGPKGTGAGALIFYWHGTGSFAGEYVGNLSGFISELKADGGMVVSFSGSSRTGGDCSGTGTFSKDDFNIADQIVACAVRDHNIDPKRIYTTGCSAGGLQAGCMATMRSSYVAAAVPNSGGVVFPQQFDDPSHVPAIMTMHGGSRDQVIIQFSQSSATLYNQFSGAGGFAVNCDHGGGHCAAPGDLYRAGWEFMKAHPYGTSPSPYEGGLPASFPSYCQIM